MPLDSCAYRDCVPGMRELLGERSVDLVVTSPPYYNAREYSQWEDEGSYWEDMRAAFSECYRVLGNHRALVLNVSDVICQRGDRRYTVARMPLVARFTVMLEELGFEYADNFVWDKGEVQSKRGTTSDPYPFYFLPINCHESVLVFHKHELDREPVPCPECGSLEVQNNGQTESGVLSWECKNPDCRKSEGGRGVRFSARSVMMREGRTEANRIPRRVRERWRRDIVELQPVVKINARGENTEGHAAPFPVEIPEFAVLAFSHEGDVVLDPFLGSGTTGLAARKWGRRWVGFEVHGELEPVVDEKTLRTVGDVSDFLS